MSRNALNSLPVLCVLLLAASCHGVPSGVIQPEEMAQLMADVHTGEAVVDMNRREYQTDSAKQAFKQSIYERHGVTSEQVDSSMAWYGRNITRYMDVYERTIAILEERLSEMGNLVAAEAMSAAGDSVDVWSGPRHLVIGELSPTNIITFRYNADENWLPGDVYTWRAKFTDNGAQSEMCFAADYTDGTVETMYSGFSGDSWHELTFRADSTRTLRAVSGYLRGDLPAAGPLRLDSIGLVRKRLNAGRYVERFRVRSVSGYSEPADNLADDGRQ